jgi:hypothetical protein
MQRSSDRTRTKTVLERFGDETAEINMKIKIRMKKKGNNERGQKCVQ